MFQKLVALIPGFEERLVASNSEEEIIAIAQMVGSPEIPSSAHVFTPIH